MTDDPRRAAAVAHAPSPHLVHWQPPDARFRLIEGPTPLEHLPRFSTALDRLALEAGHAGGPDVWIKREDLMPVGLGGNKTRGLEFLVGAALAEGADTLVTAGRRWSNHCRLAAAAAARAGLAAHLVYAGPPPATPGPGQLMSELLGATIHFTEAPGRAAIEALLERVAAELRAAGRRPYLIAPGGAAMPGAIGQALAGIELADQLAERGLRPDLLAVATATGGTQAGVLVGLRIAGLSTRVAGFAVSGPAAPLGATVESLAREMAGRSGLAAARARRGEPLDWAAEVNVDESQLGAGYGHRSAAADQAAALLARTEGILADPIFTARALAGLVALAREGRLAGLTAVFWYGGGATGLFETLAG